MPIVVRRVEATDVETYKRLRLAALADSPSAFGSTFERESDLTDDDWATRARGSASGSDRAMFFACDGQDVVGLAGGYREEAAPSDVELISMWTSPAVRRRGAGRLLVAAVVDWAIATGADHVHLWVTSGNEPAQALYEAMGFVATGDVQPLPSDPCRDEVRMSLAVRSR